MPSCSSPEWFGSCQARELSASQVSLVFCQEIKLPPCLGVAAQTPCAVHPCCRDGESLSLHGVSDSISYEPGSKNRKVKKETAITPGFSTDPVHLIYVLTFLSPWGSTGRVFPMQTARSCVVLPAGVAFWRGSGYGIERTDADDCSVLRERAGRLFSSPGFVPCAAP